jgi:site-specific DNA-methyltransferase (adenine-specific)
LARKPLVGTVVENVLTHRTGGINVDACRVETNPEVDDPRLAGNGTWKTDKMAQNVYEGGYAGEAIGSSPLGRWPANIIHDGSEDVVERFPHTKSGKPGIMRKGTNGGPAYGAESRSPGTPMTGFGDEGSAARFFYCAKANKKDRGEGNNHPTVKPTELMRYLIRLVTPAGGTVLDPFMGSGSTGKACILEGFDFIGIEKEEAYYKIAVRRLEEASA